MLGAGRCRGAGRRNAHAGPGGRAERRQRGVLHPSFRRERKGGREGGSEKGREKGTRGRMRGGVELGRERGRVGGRDGGREETLRPEGMFMCS
jgi:hypothetical protein